MFDKISKIISDRKMRMADCGYHTLRELEGGGKVRALVIKGEKNAHIEYVCPQCKHEGYKVQEWKNVSKAAMYRFETKCDKCGLVIKVPKLKGGKKKKKKEEEA